MKKIYFFLLFLVPFFSNATSVTATQSGNWNQTDTWGGSAVPGCYDTIIIPAGITVTVTVTVNLESCPPVAIFVSGALNFSTGKKLLLPNGSYVYIHPGGGLQTGGGGGSSNIISIAGVNYWSAGCGGAAPPDCGTMTGPGILCQNCALPIELLYFKANLSGNIVWLEWKTKSEQNNDYFYVQRSNDGVTWENVAWIDGAGNSNVELTYYTEDRTPFLGVSYYRLQQVDFDGNFSYSQVEVITNAEFQTGQQLLVLSTITGTQNTMVVYFDTPVTGEVDLVFCSLTGEVIYSETVILSEEQWVVIQINKPLATGVYVLRADRKIEKVLLY